MNISKLIKNQLRIERIVQIYLGIFLLSNVTIGWIVPIEELKLPPDAEIFITQLWKINLLMPMVKMIEFTAAIMFLINRNTFFALLIFYPVLFNIIVIGIHFFGSINYSIPMILGIIYLSWINRSRFKLIFNKSAELPSSAR